MTAGWQDGPPDYRPGVNALPYTGEVDRNERTDRAPLRRGVLIGLALAVPLWAGGAALVALAMWQGWIG